MAMALMPALRQVSLTKMNARRYPIIDGQVLDRCR